MLLCFAEAILSQNFFMVAACCTLAQYLQAAVSKLLNSCFGRVSQDLLRVLGWVGSILWLHICRFGSWQGRHGSPATRRVHAAATVRTTVKSRYPLSAPFIVGCHANPRGKCYDGL